MIELSHLIQHWWCWERGLDKDTLKCNHQNFQLWIASSSVSKMCCDHRRYICSNEWWPLKRHILEIADISIWLKESNGLQYYGHKKLPKTCSSRLCLGILHCPRTLTKLNKTGGQKWMYNSPEFRKVFIIVLEVDILVLAILDMANRVSIAITLNIHFQRLRPAFRDDHSQVDNRTLFLSFQFLRTQVLRRATSWMV